MPICTMSLGLELEVDNILLETMIRQSLRPNQIPTYKLPNYLLTPRNIVVLEKLTGSQIVKEFPVFYGKRRFITALTRARHPSLS